MAAAPCIAMATHLFPPFPRSCHGRAPAFLASTQAQEKSKSQQNTFSLVHLSLGHSPLFNDCKSLYSVMDRTFSYKESALLLQPCFSKSTVSPEPLEYKGQQNPSTPLHPGYHHTPRSAAAPCFTTSLFSGMQGFICHPQTLDKH